MNDPDETIDRAPNQDISAAETTPLSDSAAALVRILDEYTAAVQAGEPPDRAALLAKHAALAAQLEPCLAGIDFIHRAAAHPGPETKPAMLGEFRIVREVGRGGMGVVYEAEQTSLRRKVALKVLRFGVVGDEEAHRRFRVEAETVARLHHTNIVPIFAVGTEHDVSYYAMQFIEGRSLADVQQESQRQGRPIPWADVARWGLQAAEALAHAHQRRVIHRDIKPSNLLIDGEGVVWLTDFGLAKRSDEVTLTLIGTLMGTPRYMSPEQAEALKRPVDHRTDLYSLGASLYELATGRPAFDSATPHGVIIQVLTAEPVAPRSLRAAIPRDLETILLTCLAKEPDHRYQTAQALVEDLRSLLEGRAIRARRTPLWEKAARFAKRQKKSVAIGALAAVVSVLVAGVALTFYQANEESKKGRLSLSTRGEPLTAEVLWADRDERVCAPFTVPTRSPVALPEGDYRVRLTAPSKLSETYQLRLERGLPQDFQVELPTRDRWASGKQEATRRDWRAFPFPMEGRTDLIEVDSQSVARVTWQRQTVWSFKIVDQSQLPKGAEPRDWGMLLTPRMEGPRFVEQRPGLLQPMPDLNGDGTGDVVLSSPQQPLVFALSGKDGKVLWHRWLPKEALPQPNPWARSVGPPLLFDRPQGPVLVTTFDMGRAGSEGVLVRRVEAIDGRSGQVIWHFEAAPRFDRTIPAQRLRIAGKDVVGVVSGEDWAGLDPRNGAPVGPTLEIGGLLPGRPAGAPCRPIRQPIVADLDGDGSDDLLLLLEGTSAHHSVLMAVSATDRRRLWSSALDSPDPKVVDLDEPEATWPRLADLDGDGRAEVLVPYQVDVGPKGSRRRSIGMRAIDGKNGRVRWSHRLRTDRDILPTGRFIAGPDVDGDGIHDVFIADTQPDDLIVQGNLNQSTLYVDAISGRDGRSLWWWSQSLLSEWLRFRPLRSWEPGADGFPKLVVDAGSDLTDFKDSPQLFVLEASTGRLIHEGLNFYPTGSADLSGDGIPELWGTAVEVTNVFLAHRVVAFGRPAELWKRLGRWQLGRDYDRDGVLDLLGPEHSRTNKVDALSGRDGHIFWQATPDQSGLQNLRTEGSSVFFDFVPLPDRLGDLDGDGIPEVAVTRNRSGSFVRQDRLTVGLSVCSGGTGKVLWETPDISGDDRYLSWCAPYNVMAVDVEGRGRSDVVALLNIQGSRFGGKNLIIFDEFHLARFSGKTGRVLAKETIQVRHEGTEQNMDLPVRDFANALADLDGDGRPEIVFLLPRHAASGPDTGDLVAASATDGKVVWRHPGTMTMDWADPVFAAKNPMDVWRRFAAADLDGDRKSEVILIDVVDRQPRVERWDLASGASPRWSWRGGASDGGTLRAVSMIPRLVDLGGSGHKGIVVIADQEKAGRRVLVLDPEGHVVRSRPIVSNMQGLQIWAGDIDGDGKDELFFEDRGKLRATRGDLTTELWAAAAIGPVQEIRRVARGGVVVDLGSNLALDGATGQTISKPGWLVSPRRMDGPDPSRPMALEVDVSQTTVYRTIPTNASSPPAAAPGAGHPDPGDPRVVRPLPWVIGSPGGLGEEVRPYLGAVAFLTFATGLYSLIVLVGPVLLLARMIRGRGKVRDLLILPVSAAVALALYGYFKMGRGSPPSLMAIWVVGLAILGVPMLVIVVQVFRALWRRGWRSLPGLLTLWVVGCGIAAALMINTHQPFWMTPGERYGWEGWWTIWLPGLYASGCLVIVWTILSWPVKLMVRLVRSKRAIA